MNLTIKHTTGWTKDDFVVTLRQTVNNNYRLRIIVYYTHISNEMSLFIPVQMKTITYIFRHILTFNHCDILRYIHFFIVCLPLKWHLFLTTYTGLKVAFSITVHVGDMCLTHHVLAEFNTSSTCDVSCWMSGTLQGSISGTWHVPYMNLKCHMSGKGHTIKMTAIHMTYPVEC